MSQSANKIAEHSQIVSKSQPGFALCGYIFPVAEMFVPGENNKFDKPMMSRISRTTAAKRAPTQNTTDPPIGRQTCNV
jgi:hypothetical protein